MCRVVVVVVCASLLLLRHSRTLPRSLLRSHLARRGGPGTLEHPTRYSTLSPSLSVLRPHPLADCSDPVMLLLLFTLDVSTMMRLCVRLYMSGSARLGEVMLVTSNRARESALGNELI